MIDPLTPRDDATEAWFDRQGNIEFIDDQKFGANERAAPEYWWAMFLNAGRFRVEVDTWLL